MYFIRMLDSDLSGIKWNDILKWMQDNVYMQETKYPDLFFGASHHAPKQIYYESDGDHDGYWVFTFRDESDKVKFILRWL